MKKAAIIILMVLGLASAAMAAVTISTVSKEVGKEGGAFSVNTGGSGTWTATTTADWISLNRASGEAGVSCIYIVSANFSADARTGTIDIAGNTFTVYQTGYEATLSPTSGTADFEGGSGIIEVTVDAGVSWTAKANVSWISVTPTSGMSIGAVTYTVAAYTNGATPRTGTLTVAGKTFAVTQTGTDVVLTPLTKTLGFGVETFNVTVAALAETRWSVTPNASWLSVVDGGRGYGNDTVMMAAGANPSILPRTGTVSIGSKQVTITQMGTTNVSLSITPMNATASPMGAYGNVAVYSTPDAPWMAESQDSWITISDGLTGAGNGNTKYVATANPSLETRTGHIRFRQPMGDAWGTSILQAIPAGMLGRHVVFGDSTQYWEGNSTNKTSITKNQYGMSMSGWTTFDDGHDMRRKAIWSDGTGTIVISDMNKVFPGSYVANHGVSFSTSEGHYGSYAGIYWFSDGYRIGTSYYPYSLTSTGVVDATYSFWVYVENLPASNAKFLQRSYVSGHLRDVAFDLGMNNEGQIVVNQNGTSSILTGDTLRTGRWTMLTLVGKTKNSITVYMDGVEIGNVSTSLSFGYSPPIDSRHYVSYVSDRYKESDSFESPGLHGLLENSILKLTIGGWKGAIDEVTFIDHALTSAQVKALYDGTMVELTHSVTQGVIEPTVTPLEMSFEAAGGEGNASVTVAANTQWVVESGAQWISVLGLTNRVGSGKVSFTVAPNPSTSERAGRLTLAGKTVTVSQAGLWSQLTYDGTVFGETSGSGFISVQVEGDGTWTASSDSSWLTLLDTSGHGSAEVMFVVDDFNSAVASRTATVTIAGKTVEITQRGYELSIDPAVGEVGSNAGAGEIGITAPIDAVWEAIVSADWITLVGGNMGVGSGTLRYTVADNTTGETRTGKIIISGQEYTVTQHPYLKLATAVDGNGTVTGGGDYETNARATLRAVPGEGYEFTHWSGDAVGVEPEVTITMDISKTVTAHFIPEVAAQRLAEEKAAQGGFYTREQMKALAMGDTVIEVDPEDGAIDLAIQLQESADLSGGDWSGVDVGDGSVTVDGEGRVHIKMAPKGNTAFYRLVNGGAE